MNKKLLKKIARYLLAFILACFTAYIILGTLMLFNQDKFFYHPSEKSFHDCLGFKDYSKETFNSTRFYFKELENKDRLIIYYSGNSGRACDRSPIRKSYEKYNSSIIFVEYSGYGGDDKKPSIELLLKDVHNIANFIEMKNYNEIIVIGESLGSSLAVFQSTISKVDNLILLAPFYSTKSLGKQLFPYYPISFLEIENYDTNTWLRDYEKKLTIIHGKFDKNIPISQSIRLFEEAKTKSKALFILTFAEHNDLYNYFDTYRILDYAIEDIYSEPLETTRYKN